MGPEAEAALAQRDSKHKHNPGDSTTTPAMSPSLRRTQLQSRGSQSPRVQHVQEAKARVERLMGMVAVQLEQMAAKDLALARKDVELQARRNGSAPHVMAAVDEDKPSLDSMAATRELLQQMPAGPTSPSPRMSRRTPSRQSAADALHDQAGLLMKLVAGHVGKLLAKDGQLLSKEAELKRWRAGAEGAGLESLPLQPSS